ncbi:DUF433 domain-containing protein [Gemmatimonas sp.]|uniref:DUF433 domain-containing protein n=1 Tax=Gemmatimonas sp. TaxID=1962908 RepID=UPI003562F4D3
MNCREHIWIDAERMHGTLCLRDTRVPVFAILDSLVDGEIVDSILANYAGLRPVHVHAALAFAAELARERILPIPA